MSTARRSGSASPGRGGHRELRVPVGPPRLLRRHGDRRIEVRARSSGAVGDLAEILDDARTAFEQRVEERVRALTDRGDDAAAGDGDVDVLAGM
jgi:hypothetical protein